MDRVLFACGILALVSNALGCKGRYREDVSTICRAPGTHLTADEDLRAIAGELRSDEGRALLGKLVQTDVEPYVLLRAEATRVGVERCDLARKFLGESTRAKLRHDLEILCGYRLEEVHADSLLGEQGRVLFASLQQMDVLSRKKRLAEMATSAGLAGCAMATP